MGHIFISYARKDGAIIDKLVHELESAMVEVWIDREDIPGGVKWRRQIVDAIEAADAVVIVLSADSVESDNVRKELDIAEDAKKPVLPVLIQSSNIPKDMVYQLVGLQQIDLVTDFRLGVKRLLEAIRQLASSPQAFVPLSPQARNEIKQLMRDSALFAGEKLSLTSLILLRETARMREKITAEILALDDRAAKRMALRDQLRQTGNSLQLYVLAKEEEQDELKKKLILEQEEQVRKIHELVRSQMDTVTRGGAQSINDLWGKPIPSSG